MLALLQLVAAFQGVDTRYLITDILQGHAFEKQVIAQSCLLITFQKILVMQLYTMSGFHNSLTPVVTRQWLQTWPDLELRFYFQHQYATATGQRRYSTCSDTERCGLVILCQRYAFLDFETRRTGD